MRKARQHFEADGLSLKIPADRRKGRVAVVVVGRVALVVYSNNLSTFYNTSGKWGKYTFSTPPCSILRYSQAHSAARSTL